MTPNDFENVKKFMHSIRKAGYEVMIVGGFARDMYMKHMQIPETRDIDFVTTMPEKLLVSNYSAKKIVKEGSNHNTFFVNYFGSSFPYDVTVVEDIDADLKSRDFTLNSLAYKLTKDDNLLLHDVVNGGKDIDGGVVRSYRESASMKIAEDPIRIIRACRFAVKYNMSINENLFDAMKNSANLLNFVKKERIWGEFQKSLVDCSNDYPYFISLLDNVGAFEIIFSGMKYENVFPLFQKGNRHIVNIDSKDELLPLALLFIGHERDFIKDILTEIKFPNYVIKKIADFSFLNNYLFTLGECKSDAYIYDIISKMDSLIIQRMFYPLYNILNPEQQINLARLMFVITKGSVISRYHYSGDILIEKYNFQPGPLLGEILDRANQLFFDNYEKVGSSVDWLETAYYNHKMGKLNV